MAEEVLGLQDIYEALDSQFHGQGTRVKYEDLRKVWYEDDGNGGNLKAPTYTKPVKDGNKSLFSGEAFEIMKFMGMGKNGHIALSVTDVDRAVTFFTSQGFEFDMESATFADDGKRKFIYFKEEVGGFAVHLVKA